MKSVTIMVTAVLMAAFATGCATAARDKTFTDGWTPSPEMLESIIGELDLVDYSSGGSLVRGPEPCRSCILGKTACSACVGQGTVAGAHCSDCSGYGEVVCDLCDGVGGRGGESMSQLADQQESVSRGEGGVDLMGPLDDQVQWLSGNVVPRHGRRAVMIKEAGLWNQVGTFE